MIAMLTNFFELFYVITNWHKQCAHHIIMVMEHLEALITRMALDA